MRKGILLAVFAAALAGCVREHVREHAKAEQRLLKRQYIDAVQAYVRRKTAEGNDAFLMYDLVRQKLWRLRLVRIHKKRIVELKDGRFFTCADFIEVDGKNELDLDFYAQREPDGWIVYGLIHKVNGRRRFKYDRKNRRIPVK